MNSKLRWVAMSVGALALAIGAGTAGVIAFDDHGDDRQTIDAPAGACLEGSADCDDIPVGDAAGNACLEGSTDCNDNPAAGGAAGGTCLIGTPDCNDTPGYIRDDT